MYDTDFFIATYDLKQRIVARGYGPEERAAVFAELCSRVGQRPRVFNIETTNYCNMRCIMCQRTTDLRKPLQHMEPATFARIVEQITPQEPAALARWEEFVATRLGVAAGSHSEDDFYYRVIARGVTLHGFGEPLLDPRLPERIALLTARGIPTYFSCNPNNLRLEFMERVLAAGVGYIKLAIDALDDATARRIRGKNADFTQAYAKVLQLLELKQRMRANTVIVVTMLNFGDAATGERFLELWRGHAVYPFVKSMNTKWLLDQKGEQELNQGENTSHYKKQYCEYAWSSVTILADGTVVPCTQDLNGEWAFGNVNTQSLEEIWHSERYLEFRRLQVCGGWEPGFMCAERCDLELPVDFMA